MVMFSKIPTRYLTDLSANCNETVVGLSSPTFSFWYMDRAIRITQAPRSQRALSMFILTMRSGMEKLPGSFSFKGSLFYRMVLHSSVKAIVS